jgi:erythromycin esterase-like protein
LIREKGFRIVAFEADYPDMDEVNDFIHGRRTTWQSFHRFPTWMWRNTAFSDFVDRIRGYNLDEAKKLDVSFHGLDLYSLHSSLEAVHKYLQTHYPEKATAALEAKLCLQPWQHDPTLYGLAVWNQQTEGCREQILKVLSDIQKLKSASLSAQMNARALKSAEDYYRTMFEGSAQSWSWNVRDQHMFETAQTLLNYGTDSKIIIWEHNSHIGNCSATQMALLGEHNVGQLCKTHFGSDCYLVGFLTHTGTVLAADNWGDEVKKKYLQPSRPDSYENLLHQSEHKFFCLPVTKTVELHELLKHPRLERAVGVLYLPLTERQSHYFAASLADQFDEVIWVDQTSALTPLDRNDYQDPDSPDTYPFGV